MSLRIFERRKKSDILILEANYDNIMLENDEKRLPSIKSGIRGCYGHLSNQLTKDFLAHLSRDCNDSQILEVIFGEEMARC